MFSLAGTIGFIMLVILLNKIKRRPDPLSFIAILAIAAAETAIVFHYMSTIEVPVP